jgi:hypothetical protein
VALVAIARHPLNVLEGQYVAQVAASPVVRQILRVPRVRFAKTRFAMQAAQETQTAQRQGMSVSLEGVSPAPFRLSVIQDKFAPAAHAWQLALRHHAPTGRFAARQDSAQIVSSPTSVLLAKSVVLEGAAAVPRRTNAAQPKSVVAETVSPDGHQRLAPEASSAARPLVSAQPARTQPSARLDRSAPTGSVARARPARSAAMEPRSVPPGAAQPVQQTRSAAPTELATRGSASLCSVAVGAIVPLGLGFVRLASVSASEVCVFCRGGEVSGGDGTKPRSW